jgi:hypothetical protein
VHAVLKQGIRGSALLGVSEVKLILCYYQQPHLLHMLALTLVLLGQVLHTRDDLTHFILPQLLVLQAFRLSHFRGNWCIFLLF